ncbi:hypothetical protein [Paludibacterium purpuratum]|uniref:Halovibrin HvnA n=1 Tax=Paludibacterium purpuratum TaxID=1144873 RepID=A0A4R7B295_9NEIS|nr:hypothetical protein [Paludibacterium purpuratum]TDR73906.1 hypothetical protein DFP86_112110 [Paludibacterium purpuratum]
MRTLFLLVFCLAQWLVGGSMAAWAGPTGSEVAAQLNTRFNTIVDDCTDSDGVRVPAHYCSGIIMRTTEHGNYHAWDPPPSNNAVSFSYWRADMHPERWQGSNTLYHANGFIFKPTSFVVDNFYDIRYNCIYPRDAGTSGSTANYRCGGSSGVPGPDYASCPNAGISTSAQWVAAYQSSTSRNCTFSVINPNLFLQSLKATVDSGSIGHWSKWDELIAASWPQGQPSRLPLEAFFYDSERTNPGLANAKYDQMDLCQVAGIFLPVIRLDVRSSFTFSYNPSDQQYPSGQCPG